MIKLHEYMARCTGQVGAGVDRYCFRRHWFQGYETIRLKRDRRRGDFRDVSGVVGHPLPCPIFVEVAHGGE